jgi:diguanylate cyclase (GGDEF)-like protein
MGVIKPQHITNTQFQMFYDILQNKRLTSLLQPIVDMNQRTIHGYESLIRGPSDSHYHSPVTLFDIAIRSGRLLELDLLCRETGIHNFQCKQLPGKLFLNATPESLLEPGHRSGLTLEILGNVGIKPENVVIEMTEQYPMENFDIMRKAIEHYKSMGFEIAIDDLGAGYAGLRRWSELRPDYVKIDMHFVQGIDLDPAKQSFVRSINDIAQGLGCKVIAEGIETKAEYKTIFGMGIELGQGYFFSRPHASPPRSISNELFSCPSTQACDFRANGTTKNISELLLAVPDISPHTTLAELHSLFHNSEDLTSVPVLDTDGKPLGLIRRSSLLATLSTTFGRALYGTKSIMDFVDTEAVIAEKEWSIEQVSKLVTDHMQLQIEDDFIITDKGKYIGLGKVVQLLKKITDLQIRNARYANPLTLLPGNVPIYEKIDELLSSNSKFFIAYCDIDNFKPFNDVYGYAKGDKIIKAVADILLSHTQSEVDFVGHVGGDDFIVIFRSDDWQSRCQSILDKFKKIIPDYYKYADKKDNGIWAVARNGENSFHPIMSLSIGAFCPDSSLYISYGDISEMATQAKHNAKKIPGNSLFIERRSLSEV